MTTASCMQNTTPKGVVYFACFYALQPTLACMDIPKQGECLCIAKSVCKWLLHDFARLINSIKLLLKYSIIAKGVKHYGK